MSDIPRHYVICVSGGRVVNKRMAMFFEGLQADGLGVRMLALPRGPWVFDKSEKPTVVTRLNRISADLGQVKGASLSAILCFHWLVLPLALLIGFLRRVPVIYDEHDHYEINTLEGTGSGLKRLVLSRLARWIHRICLPWVSLVTCIHMDQQTLKRHLEQWQSAVLEIHNYPSRIWRECGKSRQPSGKLCFVYIGGVYTEKGVGAAAEAFQLLPESTRKQAELHVFGEGDDALIHRLRTLSGVMVHNGVTPSVFQEFAATHHCCGLALLANTPRYNLVGTNCTKLYEYLALGMPVIATRVGEFPQFVGGSQLGLLIDGDLNPHQLVAAMQSLVEDASLFAEFSRNAASLMSREDMTWEHEWTRIGQTGVLNSHRNAA